MAKLTATGLVGEAATLVAERLGVFGSIVLLPVIATAVISAVLASSAEGEGASAAVFWVARSLIALAIEVPAMAAWTRVCCGHDSPADQRFRFGPAEARYLRYALLFTGAFGLLGGLAFLSMQQGQGAGAFLMIGAAIGFLGILPRLMLVLPAAALGREDQKIGDMVRLSDGRTATLALACMLAMPVLLAVMLLGLRIAMAGPELFAGAFAAQLWFGLWSTLTGFIIQGALLAIIARAYLALTTPKGSASP